jgi:adenosylhomocysteine nucleosidase
MPIGDDPRRGLGIAPVLAVTGLAKEARLAVRPDVETVGAGGNPARLRALLDMRAGPGCRAVLSIGIAGGLDPVLVSGDVIVADTIIAADARYPADPALAEGLRARLAGAGIAARVAALAGVDAAVMSCEAKAALRERTGAAAADMESHVAAAFAARHGLPFAALRVVCDPAQRALPAFAAQALKPNGEPDILAVLAALLRGRARIGELVGLARDSGAAFAALKRCCDALGPGLGLGIPERPRPPAQEEGPRRGCGTGLSMARSGRVRRRCACGLPAWCRRPPL